MNGIKLIREERKGKRVWALTSLEMKVMKTKQIKVYKSPLIKGDLAFSTRDIWYYLRMKNKTYDMSYEDWIKDRLSNHLVYAHDEVIDRNSTRGTALEVLVSRRLVKEICEYEVQRYRSMIRKPVEVHIMAMELEMFVNDLMRNAEIVELYKYKESLGPHK